MGIFPVLNSPEDDEGAMGKIKRAVVVFFSRYTVFQEGNVPVTIPGMIHQLSCHIDKLSLLTHNEKNVIKIFDNILI